MHARSTIFRCALLGLLFVPACVRFSPFQIDLSDDERDQTAKNLAKLAKHERPAVSPDSPLTLAFLADTHDGYRNWDRIVAAINARPEIELVLHGGDLTDFGTKQEYHWAHDVFSAQAAPFFAAPGNHDGLSNGRLLFAEMFGPTNFTFEYAGVHFVVFNTNPTEWKVASPDLDWLERETRTDQLPTFVLTHQPPTWEPVAAEADTARLRQILATAPVSLYLYGHLHEGFGAENKGPTTFLKTQSALDGSWVLVHFDGSHFEFEACRFDTCTPGTLPPVAAGVDPAGAGGDP